MPDEPSNGRSEIAALAQQVETARGKLPLQLDPALLEVLSEREIAAERELAEWIRAQRREQRRRAIEAELAAERRDRKSAAALRRSEDADARWHRRALAARRRASSEDARLAQLYRRAEWSSRALIAVVVLGMVWAGVNVQHNLVPSGDMSDPLYWLSYGIEAMISIPIITIMVAATTAARWGRELARGKVIFFEAALLGTTVALNTGPHLAAGNLGRAVEYAIAPVMVGVVIWLHAWVSARYAVLIDGAPVVDREPQTIRIDAHHAPGTPDGGGFHSLEGAGTANGGRSDTLAHRREIRRDESAASDTHVTAGTDRGEPSATNGHAVTAPVGGQGFGQPEVDQLPVAMVRNGALRARSTTSDPTDEWSFNGRAGRPNGAADPRTPNGHPVEAVVNGHTHDLLVNGHTVLPIDRKISETSLNGKAYHPRNNGHTVRPAPNGHPVESPANGNSHSPQVNGRTVHPATNGHTLETSANDNVHPRQVNGRADHADGHPAQTNGNANSPRIDGHTIRPNSNGHTSETHTLGNAQVNGHTVHPATNGHTVQIPAESSAQSFPTDGHIGQPATHGHIAIPTNGNAHSFPTDGHTVRPTADAHPAEFSTTADAHVSQVDSVSSLNGAAVNPTSNGQHGHVNGQEVTAPAPNHLIAEKVSDGAAEHLTRSTAQRFPVAPQQAALSRAEAPVSLGEGPRLDLAHPSAPQQISLADLHDGFELDEPSVARVINVAPAHANHDRGQGPIDRARHGNDAARHHGSGAAEPMPATTDTAAQVHPNATAPRAAKRGKSLSAEQSDRSADAESEQLALEETPEPVYPRVEPTPILDADDEDDDEFPTEPEEADTDDDEISAIARAITNRRLSNLPIEEVREILTLADQGGSTPAIANELGVSRSAVTRVLDSAIKVHRPYAAIG
ncbi:hypothetical protein [Nocardia barduliensis]|uniref:hypothetical protein n=1 Tax=Nocardia barduliensis TaxID=2736643 RepID=UPI0015747094|nr:hypothetical protein [Nocardia barduliensis]